MIIRECRRWRGLGLLLHALYGLLLRYRFGERADTSKREAVLRYEMDPTTDFLSVFNHSYAKDGCPVSTSDFDWGDPAL